MPNSTIENGEENGPGALTSSTFVEFYDVQGFVCYLTYASASHSHRIMIPPATKLDAHPINEHDTTCTQLSCGAHR